MADAGSTLTMRDIAHLAGVQRPVVSMWRRRPMVHGEHIPFPEPVRSSGSMERFRRDEIVDWLARTGRGRNRDHRLDASTLSVPAGASLEDLVSLLCLAAHGDGDLADLTAADREALAEHIDPADRLLLTEVRQLVATGEMLRFIDDLVEASFGLPDALTRLEQGSAGRALGRRELTAEAIALIGAVAKAVMLHLDPEGTPLTFSGDPPSLGLAVALIAQHLVVSGNEPADRALRRRAMLHEVEVVDTADGPQLRILSVLGMDGDAVLDRVDDLVLELGVGVVGMVIGPAGLLCERLRGEAERFRAQLLRPASLVAAMRLPRGMWREAHRQALGLWICAGGQDTQRPMVADLGALPTADLSDADVAADVSGALAGRGGRAFRYLRAVDLPTILTGSPIVPPGTRAPHLRASSSNHLDRIQAAALVTAEPQEPLTVLVTAAPGTVVLRQRSLGELGDNGMVTVLRGRRIDPSHALLDGSVRVLSADGTMDEVMLDPFDAEHLYQRAHRTEPGDVVFVEGTRPRARVDEYGGSLVASPSRILRLQPGIGAGPHIVAAIINHQASTREWQTWSIPILDTAAAATLEAALAEATAYGVALRHRQGALHDLTIALIDGVAAGAVTVVTQDKIEEGQVAHATA